MRRTLLMAALSALLAVSLAFSEAAAGGTVVGSDPAGDANGINGQGFVTGGPAVPSTAPASYERADLREGRFETLYTAVPNGNGVSYSATGVAIHMTTTGAPGSDGPTTIYRAAVTINGCRSFVQTFVTGPGSAPGGSASGLIEWRQLDAACPDGVKTVVMPGTGVIDAASRTITMTLRYNTLTPSQAAALGRGNGITVGTFSTMPEFGVKTAATLTAPTIDMMPVAEWVIGSDMPANIPCTDC